MRVLVFAYACEPGIGSEPGAGWIWSRMLARMGEVWVITRESNREAIAAAFNAIPEREALHFEFVDSPTEYALLEARDQGRAPLLPTVAGRCLLPSSSAVTKDLVRSDWHLTWANAWLGTLAPLLPGRFVYGPVGGGVGMDWNFIATLGIRGTVFEVARALSRATARVLNPLARLPWRRSELILVQNPETRAWLPARYREKAVVFPHIVLDEQAVEWVGPTHDAPTRRALFVGRLLPWKGVVMALQVMVLLPDWTLIVCGDGYDLRRLRRRVHHLELDDRVTFLGWVEPDHVRELMHQEADVFLFPSLHDEGGWVIAEALAAGLPVICLDRAGRQRSAATGSLARTSHRQPRRWRRP